MKSWPSRMPGRTRTFRSTATWSPGSIGRKKDSLEWRFDIQRNGQTLRAYYTGIVPDTFKDDSEVVLTGRLTPEGFKATEMTAKCPSKYEAAPPLAVPSQ